ncbi:hypothetical protein [Bacillus sp. 03113]|uniref:hypothetical protein n=1 Tax=Bacillus sp. 03113 TaxID=2578211 RepID=UPI0011435D5E|nr:hypothetical protein [Bacillus sp. 03113]
MIKNINLITDTTKDFSLENIKYIVGFFIRFQSEYFEGNSLLDIEFIIEVEEKQYIAHFRFYNPESINFESGGQYHQISIDIQDIKDRGWEKKKYEVIDYEQETLHFYCTDIEIIAVRETQYYI